MRIELEFRIPFEAGWDQEKKEAACEKLVGYMNNGTIFESKRRMLGQAQVVKSKATAPQEPYIALVLEN